MNPFRLLAIVLLAISSMACGGKGTPLTRTNKPPIAAIVPQTIVVAISPYATAEEALEDYERIDWAQDTEKANAITVAYAARELQEHLSLAGVNARIAISIPTDEPAIVLAIMGTPLARDAPVVNRNVVSDQGYALSPSGQRIYVTAPTRLGILYGSYRLLEHLGFAWHDAYETLVTRRLDRGAPITWPTLREHPAVERRGFWIYGEQMVPDEFAVWMARNRFNVGGKVRKPLAAMLGIHRWDGEHDLIQQEFSKPGLFEANPSWYALIGGVRRPVAATGAYFNPAFGNSEAANYFAQRLVDRLSNGDLRDVDIVNVWPADDRGNPFDQSPEALAIGNETDNLLHFYNVICAAIRDARNDGRLSRPVTIAGISYFLTMRPPTNPVITTALQQADYLHLFYPIQRDWSGSIGSNRASRDTMREMLDDFAAWESFADLNYGVVEYHNVSTNGALAVTDAPYLAENYKLMTSGRQGLYAYMHPLLMNPGPLRLTNEFVSKLPWVDIETNSTLSTAEEMTTRYFSARYGEHGAAWRNVSELMSRSLENSKQLFGLDSLFWVLFQEQLWTAPPYSRNEADGFIERYRTGGAQQLPGAYSGRTVLQDVFRGLDESIVLQQRAQREWEIVLAQTTDPAERARMDADLTWFLSTSSRYRLMAATCDFVLASVRSPERERARSDMVRELNFLRTSPVLRDTISPVDQSAFIANHERLLEAD